jgi:hypothetical protein
MLFEKLFLETSDNYCISLYICFFLFRFVNIHRLKVNIYFSFRYLLLSIMVRYTAQDNEQQAIFGPFFATILLTLIVWVYMYIRRIHFLNSTKIRPELFIRPGELARISPPGVNNPSDNLKNLFEIPVVFYALSLYLFVTKQVDTTYVIAAWLFFVFRVVHSFIHCTFNAIYFRFYCYLLSCLALFFMIFRSMFAHFFP